MVPWAVKNRNLVLHDDVVLHSAVVRHNDVALHNADAIAILAQAILTQAILPQAQTDFALNSSSFSFFTRAFGQASSL